MKRVLKSRELVRILESHGWQGIHAGSSHVIYRHPANPSVLSFPFKKGKETIRRGLLGKIERLSGLELRR